MAKYFLPSLKGYKAKYLKNDIIAGLVVAALTIPVAMGYAQIAGLPPVYGLYTSILPVLGYALFCSSPQLIFGIDATSSAITGSLLAMLGIAASSQQALNFVPILSLFTGLFLILFSILKIGKFVGFISRPVMGGFISGISVSIILGQIPKVMGLTSGSPDFLPNIEVIFGQFLHANWISIVIGLVTIAIVLLGKKFFPKLPTALLILIIGTAVTAWLKLDQYGVVITGEIPRGFPSFFIPDFSTISSWGPAVLGGAVTAVAIFADSLLDSNSFALQGNYKLNDNQELGAFGISNLFATLSGCPPTSASVSRTAASAQFHGKTQVVSLVSAAMVALVVLFLSGLLYYMPQPLLSGIIIAALLGVIDLKMFRGLYRHNRAESIIFIVSAIGVLVVGVLFGVVIGVILSFIDVIMHVASPPRAVLGVIDDKEGYFDLKSHKQAHPVRDDIVIYRFSSPLFFANIGLFQKEINQIAAKKPHAIIVDGSGISFIDSSAVSSLKEIIDKLNKENIQFYIARSILSLQQTIQRNHLEDFVASGHMPKTIEEALSNIDHTQTK